MRLWKQKGSPYWYLETSRGKSRSLKTTDEGEARRILEQETIKASIIKVARSRRPVLSAFRERYLAREYTSPKTKAADRLALKLLEQAIGDVPIDEVDLEKFVKACQERKVKPVSINSYLRHIKAALRVAEGWYPKFQAPKIKALKTGKQLPRALSKEQVKSLLNKCKETDPGFYPLLVFYLYTGARRSEILRLRWEDIDLVNGLAKVVGKGNRERMIPLMQPVLDILQGLPQEGEFLFPQVHPDGITHSFQKLARSCQIQARLHDCRHTVGTHLLADGEAITTVQELLGHSSISTTQIYAKVVSETLKKIKLDY